jgi:outer membrane protein assembly factor BamB
MRYARLTLSLIAALAGLPAAAALHPPAAAPSRHPAAPPARPAATSPPILPVSKVKVGMKGYGLTVFRGTKIERFGFEVLGLLPKFYMGQPLILVRLTGGPMTSRGAYLIQGMSGSPCYVDGRLIGAFSMGEGGAKEPIGMLTPIEAMLESLDPRLPNRPSGVSEAEFGIDSPGTAAAQAAGTGLPAGGLGTGFTSLFPFPAAIAGTMPWALDTGGLGIEPLATPVMVSGLGGRAFQMLAERLRPFHLAATPSPGGMGGYRKPIPLEPGAAVGVQLISGDVEATAVGTVTYRRGDQIVAFGHPFMQIGPTNFPLTTAYVHEVFPGLVVSHKIASPVKAVGTMVQDRPYSVAGRLGPVPPMIPLTCTIDDRSTGRKRVFHARVVNHPLLASALIPAAVDEAIYEAHPVPGDATALVRTEIDTEGFGKIARENQVFDPAQIDMAALEDLSQAVDVLSRNRFQRIPLKALNVQVTIEAKRHTASVERIFVRQEKFEPGETVEVGVVLRPYRGEPFLTKTEIKVPEYAANGRATLMVSGGPPRSAAPAGVIIIGGSGAGPAAPAVSSGGPNATSVAQLLQQYLEKEKNNQLVTRILFPNPAVSVGGTTLSQLPSTLADIMRSSKSSSLRTDREEVKSVQDLDWLVTGAQSLSVTIERKDQSEKRTVESSIAKPTSGTAVTETTTSLSPSATALSAEDDLEDSASAGVERLQAASSPQRLTEDEEPPKAAHPAPAHGDRKRNGRAPKSGEVTAPVDIKADEGGTDVKLVGRSASRWTQTSQADFERGTMQGVGVSAAGDIRLAPRLSVVHETAEQYLWSLAAGDGVTYAGTGNSGLIYRIPKNGEASVLFKTGELEVHALARDRQGNLYAGTSPNGKVFRITPDGQGKLLFALNPESAPLRVPTPPARFVLSLVVAEDGTVYAGTGPDGKIYRITPDGRSTVFFQSPDQYVMSLLVTGDRLYAGTADSGLVYEINRASGEAHCIHDSDEKAITALARDTEGRLYAATAPKGLIYRIGANEMVTTIWDKSKGTIYALAAARSGEVYAACGNVIYRVGTDSKVTVLSDGKRAQFVALAVDEAGRLVAGSANVGTLYALEAAATGSFESAVHDARSVARWGQIRWTATLPEGASLQFETRTGFSPEPDSTWSRWQPIVESSSGAQVASPAARFIQYRVNLTAGTASPVLRQLVISYLTRNQPPSVALATPSAGEFWRGAHEIKWTGSDPDKDTLVYELYYSADNGKSWQRIGERLQGPPKSTPQPAASVATARQPDSTEAAHPTVDNPALARFREDLASSLEAAGEDRQQVLHQVDEMIARVGAGDPPTVAPAAAPPSAGKSESGSTRESSLRWDTSQVPDGTYLIKVIVSDRVSNPTEPLTDEVVSDPVVVANQAPRLVCFTRARKVGADRKVLIAGIAEAKVPIQGAQYRIDGGEWTALAASDGIWDGRIEPWSLTTTALTRGQHRLEVKVADLAGNLSTQVETVEVP